MSLENFLKYINLVEIIFPILDKLVSFIESIFKRFRVEKAGEQKKEVVTRMANTILKGKDVEMPPEVLSELIDIMVDTKNHTKEFEHTEQGFDHTEHSF